MHLHSQLLICEPLTEKLETTSSNSK